MQWKCNGNVWKCVEMQWKCVENTWKQAQHINGRAYANKKYLIDNKLTVNLKHPENCFWQNFEVTFPPTGY